MKALSLAHSGAMALDQRSTGTRPRTIPTTAPAAGRGTPAVARPGTPLALPGAPRADAVDLGLGVAFVVLVTLGMWARHGGLTALLAGGSGALLSLADVSGLFAALAALAGVVMVARPVWIERRYGLDRIWGWHRWVGTAAVVGVAAHTVLSVLAYAAPTHAGLVSTAVGLLTAPWMVSAYVAGAIFVTIGLTSWRRIRTRISYESWYFVHLTAYLAVVLGFGHQLVSGKDFVSDPIARWWWIALIVLTGVVVVLDRVGGLVRSLLRPMRIVEVRPEADGIASITLAGRGLSRLRADAGQFFMLRFGTKDLWWQAHPVSLSSAPTTAGLRFTVKALGDGSTAMGRLRRGTLAWVEGPYGHMRPSASQGRPVLMIAGGVGIAPLRAILERLSQDQRPVVAVRVRHESELPHRDELERLCAQRGGRLHVLAGPRSWFAGGDPFGPDALRAAVPDLAGRSVYVCGPPAMQSAAARSLRAAGVSNSHVHYERFGV